MDGSAVKIDNGRIHLDVAAKTARILSVLPGKVAR